MYYKIFGFDQRCPEHDVKLNISKFSKCIFTVLKISDYYFFDDYTKEMYTVGTWGSVPK